MAQLQVAVIEGRNFEKKDFFSENDAYVQIYLDDKKQKQKTKVKNNRKNPQWNQTIVLYEF
jgi:Ca2+-dependent lipid-binding protein